MIRIFALRFLFVGIPFSFGKYISLLTYENIYYSFIPLTVQSVWLNICGKGRISKKG